MNFRKSANGCFLSKDVLRKPVTELQEPTRTLEFISFYQ